VGSSERDAFGDCLILIVSVMKNQKRQKNDDASCFNLVMQLFLLDYPKY
jgi:hypothetical protein